jgi:hypothetical protein
LRSLAQLFIYSSVRDCPCLPLQCSGCPALLAMCLFVVVIVYSVWFLSHLSLGFSQSVQGAMLTWPGVVCGSTVCHLAHLLVSFSRASRSWHLAALEPSWFLHLMRSGDAMGRWGNWSFASSWLFILQSVSLASLQDFTLRSTMSASSL